MNHTKKLRTLNVMRKACQGAVIFGFVTSAGGNVLHAVEGFSGTSWVTLTVAIVLAALIPAIFGIMFEIATRVIFRKEAHLIMKLIAFLGAGAISGITAWNSYFHQRDAFVHFGDMTQATLLPLAIDGLMIVGSVYLIELGFQIRDIEAFIASGAKATKVVQEIPVPVKKDKEPTGRERIAATWYNSPNLTIKQIAELAGTSYNYAAATVGELRKLAEPSTELEGVTA